MKKNPLTVICGPTATGKTSLALNLCQKFNGEIVSIDSRQIYKGLEIGSGKRITDNAYRITKGNGYWDIEGTETGEAVRVHLYDLIEPDEELNVVQFSKIAGPTIERIWARGKLPVLVGGSGLYLEVLLGMVGVAKVPPNPGLRSRLENLSKEELLAELEELDPERAKTIDRNSPHRLVRAIEIAKNPSTVDSRQSTIEVLPRNIEPLWIGLNASREILYQWIDERMDEMVKAGLLEEVGNLVEKYGWEAPALNSIGYIEFKPYFENEATLEECISRAKFNTHAYARRQLTWFRRNENIKWFDVTKESFDEEVIKLVRSYLDVD